MVKGISNSNVQYINPYKNNTPEQVNSQDKPVPNTSLPSTVSVDYNVKLPQTYTKLGVEKLSNGQEIHCYKLGNGQRVMIVPMKSPKTYVNTYVNTGAMNEKDGERGISHFNEHMAFNGTFGTDGYMKLGVGDVFRKVAEMGGSTNASTGMAETNYTIGIPQFDKNDLETAVAIQAAMMNNLEMPENMVDKEHGPVCSEINMYSDFMPVKANNIATKNLYNIQSTSEDLVAGRVDNIQNVDRQKVMDYYKNNYYPANMTTVITGDVNPDEAINLVAKHFRGENKPNPDRRFEKLNPITKSVRQDIVSDKAVQTNATIAFNGPGNNNHKDQVALDIALAALFLKSNSRIATPLKEMNAEINPGVNKVSTVPADGIAITFDISTTENNSEKALKTIFNELQNFKLNDENELQQLKDAIKSKHQDIYEDPDRLNYVIGSSSFNFSISDTVNEDKVLDSLTKEDVENAVKKYLDTSKASIAVVHPASVTAESLKNNYNNANNTNISFKGNIQKTDSTAPINTQNINHLVLSNNYDIALNNTPHNTNAKAEICYKPQKLINIKPGVDILLNRMLKDKTLYKDKDEFGDYLDKNNLSQSIKVEQDGTIKISGKMPSKNIQQFINITQEQLMRPGFDEATLNKQKEITKEIFEHIEPSPRDGLLKTMYPDSNLGYTPEEILQNIDSITVDDVKNLYNDIMTNSSATVAVSAPMEDKTVMNSVISSFAKMPAVKQNIPQIYDLHKPQTANKVITKEAPHSQAYITQAYSFKDNGNLKDYVTFKLLNGILSSGDTTGLFNNLREKEKLAYSVWSDYEKDGNNGYISCNIMTTTDNPDTGEHTYDNVQKSINGFTRQINKMKNGEFTDKELEVAKKGYKDSLKTHTYGQANSNQVISDGMNNPYGINFMNEQYNIIDSITKEDIQKAANYVFNNKPIYSLVASKDTLNANKEFLDTLANKP